MPYGGDPSASFADEVRYLIGDTDPADELVSDGEVAYLRTSIGNNAGAVAIQAALNLAATYARKVDQTVGRVSVSYSQLAKQWRAVAAELRRNAGRQARIYAGGISLADKLLDDEDLDRPIPAFSTGMMDDVEGES